MELRIFVKESILSIMNAVHDAQQEWASTVNKGAINPVWDSTDQLSKHVQIVNFDVAVSASQKVGTQAAPGIQVINADLGSGDKSEIEQSAISRIKFSVPFVAPVQIVEGGNKL